MSDKRDFTVVGPTVIDRFMTVDGRVVPLTEGEAVVATPGVAKEAGEIADALSDILGRQVPVKTQRHASG